MVPTGHAGDGQQHRARPTTSSCPTIGCMSVPGLLTDDYDTPFKDEVLYRSAFIPVAALILVGPQLGLAQAALDYVIEKGHKRGIAYTRVRVATRRTDVPAGDLQGGDARRHRPPVRLPRRRRHRRCGTGRSHDDLRRAGPGPDGHRPRRRVGSRSDPGAVLGPRGVELRRGEPDAADRGATPRSPAGTRS